MPALRLAVFGALLLLQPASATSVEVNSGNGAVSFQEVGVEAKLKTISNGREAAEAELFCSQFEERLPDGTIVKVSRSKSYGQIFTGFLKTAAVVALVATIAALGMHTAGLFEAFLAANEGVPIYSISSVGNQIVGKTYMGIYYNKVAIATLTTTTAMMAGSTGFGAGTMAGLAANRIGLDMMAYKENQKVGDEIKWLSQLTDKCNYVHVDVLTDGNARDWKKAAVEGPWSKYSWGTDGIYALEKDTDTKAADALTKWCAFYAQHDLFGKASTLEEPAACKHVFEAHPELRSCDGTVDESVKTKKVELTCKQLLGLSKEEMELQVLMSQMSILKAMGGEADGGHDVGVSCGKGDACANVETEASSDQAYCALEKDPNPTLCSGEEKGEVLKMMEEAEEVKAAGIFDCLALSSCQLLRKDHDKIKGRVRTVGTLGFKTQKHIDMRTTIIKKCLSHTSLIGPVNATLGCIPGKDCPEDIKEVEEDNSWASKTADENDEPMEDDEDTDLEASEDSWH